MSKKNTPIIEAKITEEQGYFTDEQYAILEQALDDLLAIFGKITRDEKNLFTNKIMFDLLFTLFIKFSAHTCSKILLISSGLKNREVILDTVCKFIKQESLKLIEKELENKSAFH